MQVATARNVTVCRAIAAARAANVTIRRFPPQNFRTRTYECRNDSSQQRVVCHASPPAEGDKPDGGAEGEPVVNVTCRGVTFQARRGQLLRTALLEAGVSPHNGRSKLINCRGLSTCGTCAVRVEGAVSPPEASTRERLRLNFPPHRPPANQYLRLACQVRLEGDVYVGKMDGFWGSSADAESSEAAKEFYAPFGELEFILDDKRKG
mmetsp:Transcript_15859/g.28151  ORF Transcript_15859/g.28151 Transcript_15859/m.28151 type:complete len:207 (-) Transcript_15859:113-733(-)